MMNTETLTNIDYVQPVAHQEFVLESLASDEIARLGEEIISLALEPGEQGAFVMRGNHLLDQGHTAGDVHGAVEAAMEGHAHSVGGYVYSNAAILIENATTVPWPHVDGAAYDLDIKLMSTVQGNTTHEGETIVTTAVEKSTNNTPGAGTLPGLSAALTLETERGIPIAGIEEEVYPGSLARSVLKPADSIFFRTGGRDASNEPVPGTVHNFDIAPGAERRMTQPVSVHGAVNPNVTPRVVGDQSGIL